MLDVRAHFFETNKEPINRYKYLSVVFPFHHTPQKPEFEVFRVKIVGRQISKEEWRKGITEQWAVLVCSKLGQEDSKRLELDDMDRSAASKTFILILLSGLLVRAQTKRFKPLPTLPLFRVPRLLSLVITHRPSDSDEVLCFSRHPELGSLSYQRAW